MKKFAVSIGVLALLLVFAASAAARPGRLLRPRHLLGEVVSIDASASTVSFFCRDDTTRTLSAVDATKVIKDGRRSTLGGLALGDLGTAKYVPTVAGNFKALRIIVRTPIMRGKISEITSDTVTLKRPKLTRTFKVDADTTIRRNGAEAELAGLKVGDQAKVAYNKTEAGEFLARRVRAAGHSN